MPSSSNDVSLLDTLLFFSFHFTLTFSNTDLLSTAAVIGLWPFCNRTHTLKTSPTKKKNVIIKKALNIAIKKSQHIPDLLMPAWVQLIFTSVSDSRDMSINIMHYYSSSDKKNMSLCVFVHLCVCVCVCVCSIINAYSFKAWWMWCLGSKDNIVASYIT